MRPLVWFRADLRTRDNTALHEASRRADRGLVAVFLVCADQWRKHDWGPPKVDFVLRNVRELSAALADLGIPLRFRSAPRFDEAPRTLLELARQERCDALLFNREYEVNEQARDGRVAAVFEQHGIPHTAYHDQTIVQPDRPLTGSRAHYRVFTPYKRAWLDALRAGAGSDPVGLPRARPGNDARGDAVPERLPGFEPPAATKSTWPAGEREALRRLDRFVETKIEHYRTRRDLPAIDGTSTLSPYLAVGAISPRQCLAAAADANRGEIDTGDPGATTWITELIWREFYRHVLVGFPHVCRYRAFKPETDRLAWSDDEQQFQHWCDGQTGIPIVDAGMRQLRRSGWMHNRLRMIVAMFLTKNLFIDWRWGERYFMRHLVDGDFASNNGGWQWSASTGCDAAPYFRMFNPTRQSTRYDPEGSFIRRFCPELAHLDNKTIHDPSTLQPRDRAALDYPEPMVDQSFARDRVLAAFNQLKKTRR